MKHHKDGRDRYAAIIAFNEIFYELRDQNSLPMNSIKFKSRVVDDKPRVGDTIVRAVTDIMRTTPWYQTYGLNFHETMELDYADWLKLSSQITKKD